MNEQLSGENQENNPEEAQKLNQSAETWLSEVSSGLKALEKWHQSGTRINSRYLDDRTSGDSSDRKLNLFTSNVGILISTLYARFPKPMVTREFDDQEDDVARVAANIVERLIKIRDRDDFDSAMRHVVEDRLVPGLGQIWFRYEPIIEKRTTEAVVDELTGMELTQATEYDAVVSASVPCDYVFWKDFIWSPARTWEESRWAGRRVKMSKADATIRFPQHAEHLVYDQQVIDSDENVDGQTVKYAEVFEIWDKRTRTVIWVSKGYQWILDKRADPFQLKNFYPCPRPLTGLTSTTKFIPRPDYMLVQDQYLELDDLNDRISRLQRLVKVSGVYDGAVDKEVENILQPSTPDKLVPLRSFAEFAERGGFKGMMDFLPIDQIVNAIDKLRQYRQDLISQIYELTGISDIMRGATKASETATAQQLKAQYGSVKLQFLQMDVARFVEEALDIKAQISVQMMSPEIIIGLTNIDKSIDRQFLQPAIQLVKDKSLELRIQVHADSMAVPEFNAERDARMGFLRAFSEVLTAAAPILQMNPMAGVFVLQMLQWAVAAFRTGQSVESILDQAIVAIQKQAQTPPAPPPPNPKDIAVAKKDESQARLNVAKADQITVETIGSIVNPPEPDEDDSEGPSNPT